MPIGRRSEVGLPGQAEVGAADERQQRGGGGTAPPRYAVVVARSAHLEALPAIERAAAAQFPAQLIPPEVQHGVLPAALLESARAERRLWVALDAGEVPVGFALVERAGRSAYLAEVDVHPDHQRRGLGRALVGAAIDWAMAAGLERITLTTFGEVPWNAPYYQRLGFRQLEAAELDEWLAHRLAAEGRLGLHGRVAMARDLPSGAA